jgi:HK97 family phage major capsid protein
MTLREMQDQRQRLVAQMRSLQDTAEKAGRRMTAQENASWDRMDTDMESLGNDIRRAQKLNNVEHEMSGTVAPRLGNINSYSKAHASEEEKHFEGVFQQYLRGGFEVLPAEDASLMRARFVQDKSPGNIRAAQTVTTTGGGYLVPQGFSNQLDDAVKAFGGMLQASYQFVTETGASFPWPTDNDTTNIGELLGINTAAALQDVLFGQVVFNSYKYSSKIVLVPIELLQDSYFDLNTFLAMKLGQRIGRITNQHFTTGTGTGQPTGVVTGATAGKVGLTGQTLTVIYDDLIDIVHAVDPGYRMNPTARFMLADSSLKVIKKLKDTTGRPLWMPYEGAVIDPAKKNPDTIMGYPYTINQDMAAMAANAKSIIFGDFEKYKIRRVMEMTILRLTERYAEFGQVGFLVFARYDGQLVDAGTHPIQYYQNSAT